ncbi:MAG: hypothetical protein M2R45_00780 [Verrucomicrobia subdivision 3 bacterium]|nr:hypothetical protein [Limisphaerales bacterium]MCS1413115.1 hypothetical protein [Limisphaerales bacterium]
MMTLHDEGVYFDAECFRVMERSWLLEVLLG